MDNSRTEKLKGVIAEVVQQRESWHIYRLNTGETVVVTGGDAFTQGDAVQMWGSFKQHLKFGWQFHAVSITKQLPTEPDGIVKLLCENIEGLTQANARALVTRFKQTLFHLAMTHPAKLQESPGINTNIADQIRRLAGAYSHEEQLIKWLNAHGIDKGITGKALEALKSFDFEAIKSNPYLLYIHNGISFKSADFIAETIGMHWGCAERIEAMLHYGLTILSQERGHTASKLADLAAFVNKQWQCISEDNIASISVIQHYPDKLKLIITETGKQIALSELYEAEATLAECVMKRVSEFISLTRSKELVGDLNELQSLAVHHALQLKFSIMTGYPGTGKTHTIRHLLKLLKQRIEPEHIIMAAPTGMAAQQMRKAEHDAYTVHRLLGKEEKLQAAKYLIVDEASMLDVKLAVRLFSSIPAECPILLIGDPNQLPSVEPGNLLANLISKSLPTTRLTEIYRQKNTGGLINRNSIAVIHGQPLNYGRKGHNDDFFLVETENQLQTRAAILKIITTMMEKCGLALDEIQVLSPVKKGFAGTLQLNVLIKQTFNPAQANLKLSYKSRDLKIEFNVGDRVVNIVNDYEMSVVNGDTGIVTEIGVDCLEVRWADGTTNQYTPDKLHMLKHAYALTVHKAQGSEYPCVIIVMQSEHYMMHYQNLLYTAISRGKRYVYLVGQKHCVEYAIKNIEKTHRQTLLPHFIQEHLKFSEAA